MKALIPRDNQLETVEMKTRSIRISFAVMLLATGAVVTACLMIPRIVAAKRDAQLAAAVEDLGGEIRFECEWLFFPNGIDDQHLREICRIVGDRVTTVTLLNAEVSDQGIEALTALPRLRSLDVSYTRISDGGLAALAGVSTLEELMLSGTGVSDAGLRSLRDLSSLRRLVLRQTKVRGPGLAFLAELPNLRELSLDYSPVDDEGLRDILKLKQIEILSLVETSITGQGARNLRDLKSLKKLFLSGRQINEEDVKSLLHDLPQLKGNMSGPGI